LKKNTMKNLFNARTPPFDVEAINQTIERALASAGIDTTSGPMHDVTETIRRSLGGMQSTPAGQRFDSDSVIDVVARQIPSADDAGARSSRHHTRGDEPQQPQPAKPKQQPGTFQTHQYRSAAGSRAYKLFVPAVRPDEPPAMMVMLHGCTQSADDFATGTQMNRLAEEHGFLVVYPEQAAQYNPSKCWNWFRPEDQLRGAGEPALIAGLVSEVARKHGVDQRRIFVAGLSAGAAMAVVLGETYPELFAGIGAHSGLPYASAHDIPSAMAAMKGGRSGLPELKNIIPRDAGAGQRKAAQAVPLIVFHGDRDHTVQQTNGVSIVQQAEQAHRAHSPGAPLRASTHKGAAPGGRRYSRTVHVDATGRAWIENWTLHGGGHAWSGGHSGGSYTDPTGPDASAEMVRFFMALPRAGSA
jgi:poly(hydroxyalkanoate) depolymerase family esterase